MINALILIKVTCKEIVNNILDAAVYRVSVGKRGILWDLTEFAEGHSGQGFFFNKVTGCRSTTCEIVNGEIPTQVLSCGCFQGVYGRLFYRAPPYDCFSNICCVIEFWTRK